MKKKRIISIIVAFCLLFCVLPITTAFAAAPANTTVQPNADVYVGFSYSIPCYTDTEVATVYNDVDYHATNPPYWGKRTFTAFRYDISSVLSTLAGNPGYVVKSIKFKPYLDYNPTVPSGTDVDLLFWNIEAAWDESTFVKENLANILPISSYSSPAISRDPDLTLKSNRKLRTVSDSAIVMEEYNITSLFRRHIAESTETNINNFSFALANTANNGRCCTTIYTKENTTKMIYNTSTPAPAAAIEVEYELLADIQTETVTLPDKPSDTFSVSFNNSIASATVKVNNVDVLASDITINDTSLTLNYNYTRNTTYSIYVSVTDAYNQTYSNTYSFVTSHDTTDSSYIAVSAHRITETGAAEVTGTGANATYYGPGNSNNAAILYKIALPTVDSGAYLESFKFRYWQSYSGSTAGAQRVYKLAGENWDTATMTYSNISAIMDDYNTYKVGPVSLADTINTNPCYEVDVTEYANECIANNQTYMYLGVTPNAETGKFVGVSADSSLASFAKPKGYTSVNNTPYIYCENKNISVIGKTLKSLSFSVTTKFDSAALLSKIKLVKDYGTAGAADAAAAFTYNAAKNTVSLSGEAILDENSSYTFIMESGLADNFGNTLSEDLIVTQFSTTVGIAADQPKIVSSSLDITTVGYETITSLTSASAGSSVKAISQIENNYGEGAQVYIIIATYSSEAQMINVIFTPVTLNYNESGVYESDAIDIGTGATAVKAFIWSNLESIIPLTLHTAANVQ